MCSCVCVCVCVGGTLAGLIFVMVSVAQRISDHGVKDIPGVETGN